MHEFDMNQSSSICGHVKTMLWSSPKRPFGDTATRLPKTAGPTVGKELGTGLSNDSDTLSTATVASPDTTAGCCRQT
jgi:hypothetical protein